MHVGLIGVDQAQRLLVYAVVTVFRCLENATRLAIVYILVAGRAAEITGQSCSGLALVGSLGVALVQVAAWAILLPLNQLFVLSDVHLVAVVSVDRLLIDGGVDILCQQRSIDVLAVRAAQHDVLRLR